MARATAGLLLRTLRLDDEAEVMAAQRELAADGFSFCFRDVGESWADFVAATERHSRGVDLPEEFVPSTFLLAEVDGAIVGRTSIRHALNDFLAHEGGHIGYGVRPAHRRRGYATAILRGSLEVAHGIGMSEVLVTCDDDNVASATVIERCGGELADRVAGADGVLKRRYWITLT